MPQQVNIQIRNVAEDASVSPAVVADSLVASVDIIMGASDSGAPLVRVMGTLPDGRTVAIDFTGRNFMGIAGAVHGKLVERGLIPTTLNPGMALFADKAKRQVQFATETPLRNFAFTIPEAKKFWRELRRITEEAAR